MATIQPTMMADDSATAITAVSTIPATFRLFDLPTELRHRIYSFALHVPSRRARDFRIPALTGVSQQVRREALSILFAESDFIFDVATNFVALEVPAFLAHLDVSGKAEKASGKLIYKPVVECLIKEMCTYAVFRSITFRVHHPFGQQTPTDDPDKVLVLVKLRVERGKIGVEVAPGNDGPVDRRRGFVDREVQIFDWMIKKLIAYVKTMELRENFKGFKSTDLINIARLFCVRMEDSIPTLHA